jgi:hypothetical protein
VFKVVTIMRSSEHVVNIENSASDAHQIGVRELDEELGDSILFTHDKI